MINQQVGDLLEVHFDGKWYYLIVLTKRVMLGGNIVFAYHSPGHRLEMQDLLNLTDGFNVCVDLLYPKRNDAVSRVHKFTDVQSFFKSPYAKSCGEHRPNVKARRWFIYKLTNLQEHFLRTEVLPDEYHNAMDSGCYSFDLVAGKILQKYTPKQNEHI